MSNRSEKKKKEQALPKSPLRRLVRANLIALAVFVSLTVLVLAAFGLLDSIFAFIF